MEIALMQQPSHIRCHKETTEVQINIYLIIFPIYAFLQLQAFYLRKHIFIYHLAGAGDTCPPRPLPDIKTLTR